MSYGLQATNVTSNRRNSRENATEGNSISPFEIALWAACFDRPFKTHVWGFLECHNGAICHAAPSYLTKFDRIQENFQEINMDEASDFLEFNVVPPSLRRNIGILGLLQKRILGKAHPIFQELLPYHRDIFGSLRQNEHSK